MAYRRADIVAKALDVLDAYGLADLSMRRLGSELGVQPSALYHHFANKQTLLAALADEILHRGARPRVEGAWDEQVTAISRELRDAMLAYRDGAELVATAHAFGLGAVTPDTELASAYDAAGLPDDLLPVAVSTVLHFVFGHAIQEQTHLQASSAGAIDDQPREASDFELGLALILDGIRSRSAERLSDGRAH
ncbi:TetR/AcrR family transcriptional regulator C-terminal domain-containing protein [Nocardioides jensenii]|uniref:TetR/AcrR family transcriptional regulator C-terminal domain-containing protein n=1 Tax=Nocardioides jensenii TaxID=1843 RepID=UPI00082E4224|nr:TetR/AcrR family transcriptional regulator C-terminal domain-containing protein [Nocardioides jensenii]